MHKGVILLVKADDKGSAIEGVNHFMEQYEGRVWDWFVIGGRWTGQLDGYEVENDERNYKSCWLCNGTGFRSDLLGQNIRLETPSYTCNSCGVFDKETGTWKHGKFGAGLALEYPSEIEHDNNAMPLADCLKRVREYADNVEKKIEEELAYAERMKAEGRKSSQGYALKRAGELMQEEFCFDCDVYNVEAYNYSIPEGDEVKEFFAVIVDMHN